MKLVLTTLLLSLFISCSLARNSLNLPISFSATLRPGAVFFRQFVPLTSHIYSYVNFSSNGTAINEYISEKDYAKPDDTEPKYQFYMNSETNYAYYVDGVNCTKVSLTHYPFFCLYVPSFITVLFLNGFNQEASSFNTSYTECPYHHEIACDKWYAPTDNITLFEKDNALEVLLLSGILYKPMIYDNFKPAGPVPGNFLPEMECIETDYFPFCKPNSMGLNVLESRVKNLRHFMLNN